MNLQFYLEKLLGSSEFLDFKKENSGAYFCSGFFSIDKKGKDNKIHLDYFIEGEEKIFSFNLNGGVEKVPAQNNLENFIPEKIDEGFDFDFEEIEKMIEENMKENKVNKKIEKFLFSLQSKNGVNYLVGTVFISGLGMIKIKINLDENKVEEFEKKSFFDMLKIVKKK